MKVVLFCGGLGTRIREYSETIPKPMIPVGNQPILWHVMQYYSQYGHRDFVLCLGYKANTIKDFFLNYRPQAFADCVVSGFGSKVELLGEPEEDWRVTLIDTGIWRNIGERLWAVREHVQGEEIFLANYSDGLTNVNLDDMIERFKRSDKIACFLAIRPPLTYHLADIEGDGRRPRVSARPIIRRSGSMAATSSSEAEIFDYMHEGEELVLEPFNRLIQADKLMAYKHEGFWRSMDTLKDRQILEDMVEQGKMPWRRGAGVIEAAWLGGGGRMRATRSCAPWRKAFAPLSRRSLGRHRDRSRRHDSRADHKPVFELEVHLVRLERDRFTRKGSGGIRHRIPSRHGAG